MRKLFTFLMVALFSASVWATTYTVAGNQAVFGTNWDATNTNNDMTQVGETSMYQLVLENVEVTDEGVEFQVCQDHAWSKYYPNSHYWMRLHEAGTYTITITFDSESKEVRGMARQGTEEMVTIYFVNTNSWEDKTVKAHVWNADLGNSGNYKTWPGETMVPTGSTTLNDLPIYSYTFPAYYDRVIFSSNGADDAKTGDLEWSTDKPYYSYNMGKWYASSNDVPKYICLHGDFTGSWANTTLFEESYDGTSVSMTLKDLAVGNYTFGVRIGRADNYTVNGATFTRGDESKVIEAGSGNCTLNVDKAGNYTFTWTYATNTLTVAYPAYIYTIVSTFTSMDKTATVGDMAKQGNTDTYLLQLSNVDHVVKGSYDIEVYREHAGDPIATKTLDIAASGKYNIDFTFDASEEDPTKALVVEAVYQGPATTVDNTEVEGKAVKVIRDGQLLIVKDGKTFNVLGTVVR